MLLERVPTARRASDRQLKEIDVEEHRTKTRHYKDWLHDELVLLDRLQGKVEGLLVGPETPAAAR